MADRRRHPKTGVADSGAAEKPDASRSRPKLAALIGISLAFVGGAFLASKWVSSSLSGPMNRTTTSSAEAGYLEAAACRECHAEIWKSYSQSGMGRSFYAPRAVQATAFEQPEPYYHPASDRYYQVVEREGAYFQSRWQIGFNGSKTNLVEKRIDFVMGSGTHARTFLHRTVSDKILQLPLGWYAENGGAWAMSPGYDRSDHDGFQRLIAYDCMFCHNGYPNLPAGADVVGRTPRYEGQIPEGIDCQRCHGPGREHVDLFAVEAPSAERIRSSIVNPARLSTERQLEVCFQCHLETTSRPLPNVTHRYERPFFSYRPGEPLADYALYFDHQKGGKWDEKFEINHAAYRLRQSPCFQQSNGRMTCTTCHDPHRAPQTDEASALYSQVCLQCHETSVAKLIETGAHAAGAECLTCHMPKRRTQDVVHALMTDHRIQRTPSGKDPLAAITELNRLADIGYRGEVVLYYPDRTALRDSDEVYSAAAQVMQSSNLEVGLRRLDEAVRKHRPEQAEIYAELGDAYQKAGRFAEAVPAYEEALRRKPLFAFARRRLGAALAAAGDPVRAEGELREAARMDPQEAGALLELSLLQAQQGRFADAIETTHEALRASPEMPALHNTLGGSYAKLGRLDDAVAAYRETLRLQPDFTAAEQNLANLLATKGAIEEAEFHWLRVIARDPSNASARYNYAASLAQRGRLADAQTQLQAAVAAQPSFSEAHAFLGEILQAAGRPSEALLHYEKALEIDPQSPDTRWSLALLRLSQGDASDLRSDLEAVLQLDPDRIEAHLILGQVLLAEGARTEGIAHLEQAASSSDPDVRRRARESLEQANEN